MDVCVMETQKTRSICPECKEVIEAVLAGKNSRVTIKKRCGKHGDFEEVIYDVNQLENAMGYMKYVSESKNIPGCPYDCERCSSHQSQTLLAVMDLTNRCNLDCKYCFANAARSGYLYEPSLEQIRAMFLSIEKKEPVCKAVLFSGGEPTIRDDLPDIVRIAGDMGFEVKLLATNGFRLANDLEYMKRLYNAGLSLLYLSFDGFSNETNHEKKNHLFIDKLLENCRHSKMQVILVPAIGRENAHEAFKFIRFAAENIDVIRGVNFQPISFCGRMEPKEREMLRYTISDLCLDIEKQSNGILKEGDFYPVSAVVPFQKLLCELGGVEMPLFTVHPLCGRATYLFLDGDELVPITEIMDVPELISLFERWSKLIKNKRGLDRNFSTAWMIKEMKKLVHFERIPKRSNAFRLLVQLILKRDMASSTDIHMHSIFVGAMHFQDCYNMDLERLKRCGIHYVTPDNSLIPFCAYNVLGYREKIEEKFSVPRGAANYGGF